MEDYSIDIDRCINSKNQYDFAIVVQKHLKYKYQYLNNNWYQFNEKNNEYVLDNKGFNLSQDIKNNVSALFQERAEFWNQKSLNEKDTNLISDYKLKSCLLHNCVDRILNSKNDRFLHNILQECKSLFAYNE